eukprot:gnl/TRDRNA2_/TRDRNA2_29511_c0_seq1.p1 gnl/TRDRNA2_/TRDRNA2_29511_c0~~gnl/TRDRNA2_/TRDRNA2_29511_c0_seq1.p1  ORF type:complete len:191 (-),score=15.27 gnl/TRDRNA2_/TRDRNA2_29511_c0_seq1:336-908(-)
MARVVRRSLRLKGLPLFSLGSRWTTVSTHNLLPLHLFEPRYVELARRIQSGSSQFGYAEEYPPESGGAGVLVEASDFRWAAEEGPVFLVARGLQRFRILSAHPEALEDDTANAPLYVAHVELLPEANAESPQKRDEKPISMEKAMQSVLLNSGIEPRQVKSSSAVSSKSSNRSGRQVSQVGVSKTGRRRQ